MIVPQTAFFHLFTHPKATEAGKCCVKCAVVATEQLLNGFFLLGRKLQLCTMHTTHLFLLDSDPPLQYLLLRHDH